VICKSCARKARHDRVRQQERHEYEVLRLAPEEACTGDMLVLIRWHDRNVAIPLSQLTAIDENESTDQAIADWQYWVAQGYLF
jgi:hypothetical protein